MTDPSAPSRPPRFNNGNPSLSCSNAPSHSTCIPAILQMPPTLYHALVSEFDNWDTFLSKGGRSSGKTQGHGRFVLYLCEQTTLRVVCGRETQNSIEDSVYTVLCDLIRDYSLNFTIYRDRIVHNVTDSTIKFKGFREAGSVNIKGLEGVDLLWIDEAQAITEHTLNVIMPTIRKKNARIMFSMNPNYSDDAVIVWCKNRQRTLTLTLNYTDNPFCPPAIREQAQQMAETNPKMYRHIWLGEPNAGVGTALFSAEDLAATPPANRSAASAFRNMAAHKTPYDGYVIGCDISAGGEDRSVAAVLGYSAYERTWALTDLHTWDEASTMKTAARILEVASSLPSCDACVVDADSAGKGVYDRLEEIGFKNVHGFRSASRDMDTEYRNRRAQGYFMVRDMLRSKKLIITDEFAVVLNQLSRMRFMDSESGLSQLITKKQIRKELGKSPDEADAVMMACFAATEFFSAYAPKSKIRIVNRSWIEKS